MIKKDTVVRFSLLVFLSVFLIHCHSKKAPLQRDTARVDTGGFKKVIIPEWDEAKIDNNIPKDPVYTQLDTQNEIFSAFEKQDTLLKRTSDVAYFTGKKIDLKDTAYAKLNNCKAHYFHSDTLYIAIGIGNGFTNRGFLISYKNRKFHTEPYFSTDMVMEDEIKPVYKTVYQKLILDKAHYKIGDSLYGRIEFMSIETTRDNRKQKHFGIGNFRAKVRKF